MDSKNQNQNVADKKTELSTTENESTLAEYIIVLNENVSIADALNNLQDYEVQVIRDLNKNRYLIGLVKDPGIEKLTKEVEKSEHIKQIQPNYSYTIQ